MPDLKTVYKKLAHVLAEIPPLRLLVQLFYRLTCRINDPTYLLFTEMNAVAYRKRQYELLTLLTPRKVIGIDKIRVGGQADGGYVMLNDLESIHQAYSLGIAGDVTWDLEMAERGINISQFDYSIKEGPVSHPRFTFFCKKVECIGDLGMSDERRQILKIDIEHSEWEFFKRASVEELKCFTQIVGEFHYFELYWQSDWWQRAQLVLDKLNRTHQLIHIHGNNVGGAFRAGDMKLPTLLELTYVLRSEYDFEDTQEPFPGPLDSPNKKDYCLNAILRNNSSPAIGEKPLSHAER